MQRPNGIQVSYARHGPPVAALCARAADAGFDGIELAVADHADVPAPGAVADGACGHACRADTEDTHPAPIGRADDSDRVGRSNDSALVGTCASGGDDDAHRAATGRTGGVLALAVRCPATTPEAAAEAVLRWLERAASFACPCINLSLSSAGDRPGGLLSGHATLRLWAGVLEQVWFDAERAGVNVAIDTAEFAAASPPTDVSPCDVRGVIDDACSWTAGVCMHVAGRDGVGQARHWLHTLNRRVCCVRVAGLSAPAMRDVVALLDDIRYTGPVIRCGGDETLGRAPTA